MDKSVIITGGTHTPTMPQYLPIIPGPIANSAIERVTTPIETCKWLVLKGVESVNFYDALRG